MVYDLHSEWGDGLEQDQEGIEFDCYLRQHENGAAIDYCGFTAYVFGDAFSFDVRPYKVFSWYYGEMIIQISGAGDLEGSSMVVVAEQPDGDMIYRLEYEVTHVGEL